MALHYADVAFLSEDQNKLAKHLVVGHRFLFLDANAVAALPEPDRNRFDESVVGDQMIMALPEEAPLSIAGIQFHSPLAAPISWLSLTCDRMVYDELNDR